MNSRSILVAILAVVWSGTASAGGPWEYGANTDPTTDKKMSMASASIGTSHRNQSSIAVKCEGGEFLVAATKGIVFHVLPSIDVQYRIDGERPRSSKWYWLSKMNVAALDGADAMAVARDFARAMNRIVVVVGNESPIVFSAKRSTDTISKVMLDCGVI